MRRGGEGEERRQRRQKAACDGVTGFVDSQGIAGTQFDPEITKKGPVSKLPPHRKHCCEERGKLQPVISTSTMSDPAVMSGEWDRRERIIFIMQRATHDNLITEVDSA